MEKFVVLGEYLEHQQIAADVKEKLANLEEDLLWGISLIYLSLSNKWKPYQGTINSRSHKS